MTNRRKTFDLKLGIQALLIISSLFAVWYASQADAAIMQNDLDAHVGSTMLHPIYEELTEEFVPRTEVKLQLDNIDVHLKNIDGELKKIDDALLYIRNNMQHKQ